MLSPLARAAVLYIGGGFALALLCAAFFFLDPPSDERSAQRRDRRRAAVLIPIGVAHPVVALAGLALARELDRAGAAPPLLLPAATGSVCMSLLVMGTVVASAT